jgi:RNA polymerase sigma factor (TIGR02999 family)
MSDVTSILQRMGGGDPLAAEQLLPAVYRDLRRLAANRMANELPGHTLQATALVHEAYLRLVQGDGMTKWDSRHHFFAAAAEAMRRILIDQARSKQAEKRGGQWRRCELAAAGDVADTERSVDLLAMDEALQRLEALEPRKAKLVKLRYFAGLTIAEVAEILGISTATADRDWAYARAWLHAELRRQ